MNENEKLQFAVVFLLVEKEFVLFYCVNDTLGDNFNAKHLKQQWECDL